MLGRQGSADERRWVPKVPDVRGKLDQLVSVSTRTEGRGGQEGKV